MRLARILTIPLLCMSLVGVPTRVHAVTTPAATSLQMLSKDTRIGYQQVYTIKGILRNAAGQPVPGRRVVVQVSANGMPVHTLTSVITAADGTASLRVRPLWATCYRFRFTGDSLSAPSTSGDAIITPKASLPAPQVPSVAGVNRFFMLYGLVRPMDRAANRTKPGYNSIKISFYRYQSGKWVHKYDRWLTARTYVQGWGKYWTRVALPTRGSWRVRAFHWCADHAPTYSAYHSFAVR